MPKMGTAGAMCQPSRAQGRVELRAGGTTSCTVQGLSRTEKCLNVQTDTTAGHRQSVPWVVGAAVPKLRAICELVWPHTELAEPVEMSCRRCHTYSQRTRARTVPGQGSARATSSQC